MNAAKDRFPRWLWIGAVVYFVLYFFIEWLPFRIGFDPQTKRCLPASVYVLDLREHEPVAGEVVSYYTHGLMPIAEDGTVFTKLVVAGPGDTVSVGTEGITTTHTFIASSLSSRVATRMKKPLQSYRRDWVLKSDEYFLIGTLPNAYDSRYFGPVKRHQIFAKAWPLW